MIGWLGERLKFKKIRTNTEFKTLRFVMERIFFIFCELHGALTFARLWGSQPACRGIQRCSGSQIWWPVHKVKIWDLCKLLFACFKNEFHNKSWKFAKKIWGLFWPSLWSVAIFDTNGQIFCHVTTFNSLNADFFQIIAKASESFVVIQFRPVSESPGPSEDRS